MASPRRMRAVVVSRHEALSSCANVARENAQPTHASARHDGSSNTQCKLLGELFTNFCIRPDGKIGEHPMSEYVRPGERPHLLARSFSHYGFAIDPADLHVLGYGIDARATSYLSVTLSAIRASNGHLDIVAALYDDGDGHCLVHSLSRSLVGKTIYWHALRLDMFRTLRAELDRFRERVPQIVWEDVMEEASPMYVSPDVSAIGLTDAHVFALAHVLRRPIIVYDDDLLSARSAVFLPLLCDPATTVRSPLAVGWASAARDHFVSISPIGLKDVCIGEDDVAFSVDDTPLRMHTDANGVTVEVPDHAKHIRVTPTRIGRPQTCYLGPSSLPHEVDDGSWAAVRVWGVYEPGEREQLLHQYFDIDSNGRVVLNAGPTCNTRLMIEQMRAQYEASRGLDLELAESAFDGMTRVNTLYGRACPVTEVLRGVKPTHLTYCGGCATVYDHRFRVDAEGGGYGDECAICGLDMLRFYSHVDKGFLLQHGDRTRTPTTLGCCSVKHVVQTRPPPGEPPERLVLGRSREYRYCPAEFRGSVVIPGYSDMRPYTTKPIIQDEEDPRLHTDLEDAAMEMANAIMCFVSPGIVPGDETTIFESVLCQLQSQLYDWSERKTQSRKALHYLFRIFAARMDPSSAPNAPRDVLESLYEEYHQVLDRFEAMSPQEQMLESSFKERNAFDQRLITIGARIFAEPAPPPPPPPIKLHCESSAGLHRLEAGQPLSVPLTHGPTGAFILTASDGVRTHHLTVQLLPPQLYQQALEQGQAMSAADANRSAANPAIASTPEYAVSAGAPEYAEALTSTRREAQQTLEPSPPELSQPEISHLQFASATLPSELSPSLIPLPGAAQAPRDASGQDDLYHDYATHSDLYEDGPADRGGLLSAPDGLPSASVGEHDGFLHDRGGNYGGQDIAMLTEPGYLLPRDVQYQDEQHPSDPSVHTSGHCGHVSGLGSAAAESCPACASHTHVGEPEEWHRPGSGQGDVNRYHCYPGHDQDGCNEDVPASDTYDDDAPSSQPGLVVSSGAAHVPQTERIENEPGAERFVPYHHDSPEYESSAAHSNHGYYYSEPTNGSGAYYEEPRAYGGDGYYDDSPAVSRADSLAHRSLNSAGLSRADSLVQHPLDTAGLGPRDSLEPVTRTDSVQLVADLAQFSLDQTPTDQSVYTDQIGAVADHSAYAHKNEVDPHATLYYDQPQTDYEYYDPGEEQQSVQSGYHEEQPGFFFEHYNGDGQQPASSGHPDQQVPYGDGNRQQARDDREQHETSSEHVSAQPAPYYPQENGQPGSYNPQDDVQPASYNYQDDGQPVSYNHQAYGQPVSYEHQACAQPVSSDYQHEQPASYEHRDVQPACLGPSLAQHPASLPQRDGQPAQAQSIEEQLRQPPFALATLAQETSPVAATVFAASPADAGSCPSGPAPIAFSIRLPDGKMVRHTLAGTALLCDVYTLAAEAMGLDPRHVLLRRARGQLPSDLLTPLEACGIERECLKVDTVLPQVLAASGKGCAPLESNHPALTGPMPVRRGSTLA
eukprot:m.125152 g.125152  ORF g.125152 m.125152 type:complete len:1517 (-) comp9369_c0_seq1:56-4606(-)